ncbi:MAG: hypothetical protein AB8I08_11655 [Sandaracinaceae bacterium]
MAVEGNLGGVVEANDVDVGSIDDVSGENARNVNVEIKMGSGMSEAGGSESAGLMPRSTKLDVALGSDELKLLHAAAKVWATFIKRPGSVAEMLGYRSKRTMVADVNDMLVEISSEGGALTLDDWNALMFAAEVAFVSDELGACLEGCRSQPERSALLIPTAP